MFKSKCPNCNARFYSPNRKKKKGESLYCPNCDIEIQETNASVVFGAVCIMVPVGAILLINEMLGEYKLISYFLCAILIFILQFIKVYRVAVKNK